MNLVQQSGDLELINILQGVTNPNVFNSQPLYNITVLVPQQNSIRQLGSSQDLSIVSVIDCREKIKQNHKRLTMQIFKNIFLESTTTYHKISCLC